jgi:hypothetical protein
MEDVTDTYYVRDAAKVIQSLQTDSQKGLTKQEAEKRLAPTM